MTKNHLISDRVAYINSKKEYKLEISVGDQKSTVYKDANGTWIQK
jgi:hypothetical protein